MKHGLQDEIVERREPRLRFSWRLHEKLRRPEYLMVEGEFATANSVDVRGEADPMTGDEVLARSLEEPLVECQALRLVCRVKKDQEW